MQFTCHESEIGKLVTSPQEASRLMLPLMLAERETIVVACLDERRKVITAFVAAIGGIDYVVCEPPAIFRMPVALSATSILVAHNHPSGDPTPSQADIQTTKMLEACATILGIVFIDHLVLTRCGKWRSIAEYNERGF